MKSSALVGLVFCLLSLTGCQSNPAPTAPPAATVAQQVAPTQAAPADLQPSPTLPHASASAATGEPPTSVAPASLPTSRPLPTDTPESSPAPAPSVASAPDRSRGPRPIVPVSAEEVVRGDPSRPWISLVFNAGAGYQAAPAILDVLADKGVRTTFFLLGWWAAENPDLVRRMVADGHEVASHGHQVFDLTSVSDAKVAADLTRADEVISSLTGRTTRPLWSPSAGYRDARVRQIAASLGYRPIYWTLDSGDWRENATAADVSRRVLDGAVNGAIIVMHTDSPRTADTIAPVLPDIIDGLRAQGYRLVTVTELVTGVLDEEVPE